jgi:hypothetical protein
MPLDCLKKSAHVLFACSADTSLTVSRSLFFACPGFRLNKMQADSFIRPEWSKRVIFNPATVDRAVHHGINLFPEAIS